MHQHSPHLNDFLQRERRASSAQHSNISSDSYRQPDANEGALNLHQLVEIGGRLHALVHLQGSLRTHNHTIHVMKKEARAHQRSNAADFGDAAHQVGSVGVGLQREDEKDGNGKMEKGARHDEKEREQREMSAYLVRELQQFVKQQSISRDALRERNVR